ncbi:pyridoxal-phosphate dependent enzyme [Dactylosporangium sp. NPDC000521]|uniref:pyridoxal-phosphate dependent enzyme n=1 Tax=Dactylosporangium sp. NPDC000521 TaxID=3363975 RepID=UPI00367540F2
MVHLARSGAGLSARLVAKLESANPGGSVKDRIAAAVIEESESAGVLAAGGSIVEATSGNAGIGLAVVAAARGTG